MDKKVRMEGNEWVNWSKLFSIIGPRFVDVEFPVNKEIPEINQRSNSQKIKTG